MRKEKKEELINLGIGLWMGTFFGIVIGIYMTVHII